MLGENIRNLRKNKGYSQETLAEQLHVVRQTVSKWEKGLSVPDAEMLNRLSELFEVPVDVLLGSSILEQENKEDISQVAKQLAILNEQLANQAVRKRQTIKRVIFGMIAAVFLAFAIYLICAICYKANVKANRVLSTTHLECTLDGETYKYGITYDQNFQIIEAGGDAWIANHVQTEQYEDANILIAQIEDYFAQRGGTCTRSDEIGTGKSK